MIIPIKIRFREDSILYRLDTETRTDLALCLLNKEPFSAEILDGALIVYHFDRERDLWEFEVIENGESQLPEVTTNVVPHKELCEMMGIIMGDF